MTTASAAATKRMTIRITTREEDREIVPPPAPATGRPRHRSSFGGLLSAEVIKLRRSSVWIVVVILPVLAVVSGTVNYLMNQGTLPIGWDTFGSQVLVFYGLFFFSLGVSLLASSVWRPEHHSASWNAMRATPDSPAALAAAKTLVLSAPVLATQVATLTLTWVVGMAIGLGAAIPLSFTVSCLLTVLAAQPLIAVQSLLSMRMRSFAAPVAVCLAGIVVGVGLVTSSSPLVNLWPAGLVSRCLTLGSTAVSNAGGIDIAGLAPILGGTAATGAACWGALVLGARRHQ